jgi:hypothetical protein
MWISGRVYPSSFTFDSASDVQPIYNPSLNPLQAAAFG